MRHFAVRRALIAALLVSFGLSAQENLPESAPPGPEAPRASVHGPGPQAGGEEGRSQNGAEAPKTIPETPAVNEQGGTEEPGRASDEATENREDKDLKAQQSMADSAVAMLALTRWQIAVGLLGIAGLAWTIHYSRETARAAVAATQLAENTAVAQLRAYVHVASVTGALPNGEGGVFAVSVEVRNFGQTPARNVRTWLAVWPAGYPDAGDFANAPRDLGVPATLAPGGHVSLIHGIGPILSWLATFRAGTHAVYAYGRITYTDAFGNERFTNYRLVCYGPRVAGGNGAFDLCREGNEAD